VQARVTAYAFGDSSILARGIRMVARSQTEDGALHAHPPADFHHRLPDFMMTWVGTLVDYYHQTGETGLLKECLPTLHRLFEFFKGKEASNGLIGNLGSWWVFLDWQPLHKGNYSAVLNMFYLKACRWAAQISQLCGDTTHAAAYEDKATKLQATIEALFWLPKEGCWADGVEGDSGKPVETLSQHSNALAILLNLKPETHESIARNMLVKPAKNKRTKVTTGSPFFYSYIVEAIAAAGLRDEAIDILSQRWSEFLDAGAVSFWELWANKESRCHAWSSSPLYHISQQVLGVMPTAPGWTKVRIQPLPMKLEFAKGAVPTPKGPIKVEWERAEDQLVVRVDLPQGIEVEFISPSGEKRNLDAGVSEFTA
jgi:hypothetical protein